MQRRNPTLLLLVLLLAGGAGWVWWDSGTELPVLPTPTLPEDSQHGAKPDAQPDLSPDGHVPLPVAQDPPQPPLAADAPRVVVVVRELEAFVPTSPPRVLALDPVSREPLLVTVLAGVGADPFEDGARAGVALAAVQWGAGRLLRQVSLEAKGTAEVPIGPRAMVRGTIVDANGRPIPGARVSLGEVLAEGELRTAETGAEGHFELDTPAGAGVPVVVQEPQHASQWRAVTVLAQGDNVVDMVLPEAGTLDVQLACEAHEIEAARVFVVSSGVVASEVAQYPFFLQVLSHGFPVDAQGRASVSGLPRVGTIGLVVRHPGAAQQAPREVKLAGARSSAIVPLSVAPLVKGRIIDERGLPVPGAVMQLHVGPPSSTGNRTQRLLPPGLSAIGATYSLGDALGVFSLGSGSSGGVAPSGQVLSVRAPGHVGREIPFGEGVLAEPIELAAWGEGEPSLRLLPPRAGVRWGSEWSLSGGLKLVHEADAAPTIAVPRAGRFEVTVTTFVGAIELGTKTQILAVTGVVAVPSPKID